MTSNVEKTVKITPKEHPMSFYDATVPAFLQILGSLTGLLTKAEAHCKAKNIAPEVLLSARLYPDMLPFSRQIELACDFAAKGCARLTHSEVPVTPDTEKSFDELKQRLARAIDYVKGSSRRIRPRRHREVTFRSARPTMTLKGQNSHPATLSRISTFTPPSPRHPAPQRRGDRQT